MSKNLEFTDKLRSSGQDLLDKGLKSVKYCLIDKTFHFTINDLAKIYQNNLMKKYP